MFRTSNRRIALVAILVFVVDQISKQLVKRWLAFDGDERVVIRGFFKFVHWNNTGAAWSMFMGNNKVLAVIAILALVILFLNRRHFEAHTLTGQIALGLIFGGITGNLTDRLLVGHVTDFLYFYLQRRGGPDIYFPAFNVADSGICIGVALIFIMSLRNDARLRAGSIPSETGS